MSGIEVQTIIITVGTVGMSGIEVQTIIITVGTVDYYME